MHDGPGWGPKKLRAALARANPGSRSPAVSAFALIFERNGLVVPRLIAWAGGRRFGLLFLLRPLPAAATAVVGVVALDLLAYVAHVLLHRSGLGWRFHRVHHCDPRVDVTTALRQHPGETIWRIAWQVAGTILLGLPLWAVAAYLVLSATNADSNYSNVLSVWDRLFGTHTAHADLGALRYGLDGIEDERTRSVRGLLSLPFRA